MDKCDSCGLDAKKAYKLRLVDPENRRYICLACQRVREMEAAQTRRVERLTRDTP
jgi:hypothetical protein